MYYFSLSTQRFSYAHWAKCQGAVSCAPASLAITAF